MKNMRRNKNRISYIVGNDCIEVQATVLGANITADVKLGNRIIQPFYTAPWYNYADENVLNGDYVLRGNFFAFPFGLNKPKNGINYPCHGFATNNGYILKADTYESGVHEMKLLTEIEEDHAELERIIKLKDGENNIYQTSIVTGATGKYPVGYHPTIDIPTERSSAIIDFTKPVEAWTSPTQIEDYTKGGYSSLVEDYKIEDMTKVPIVYGKTVDLTKQPFITGFDDIWMLLCDQTRDFSWTTVSMPTRGYLYYQLKDPKCLANAMYWTSYKGRYYAPWNGKVDGCIEVGAQNGYFYYGITECEDNALSRRGFTTCTEFDGSPKEFKMIEGFVEIPPTYTGTADIEATADGIIIKGKNGEQLGAKVDLGFLK